MRPAHNERMHRILECSLTLSVQTSDLLISLCFLKFTSDKVRFFIKNDRNISNESSRLFHYSVFKVLCAENAPLWGVSKSDYNTAHRQCQQLFSSFFKPFFSSFSTPQYLVSNPPDRPQEYRKKPEKRGIFRHFPAPGILSGNFPAKKGQPKPAAPDSPLSLILTLPPVPPTAFLRLQTNPLREPDHTDRCSDTAENTTQHYVA